MKTIFTTLAAMLAMSIAPAQAEDAQGVWSGTIANSLRVIVQFTKPADGPWQASITVPAQNFSAPVENVVVTPEQVSFALPRLKATYSATWNAQDGLWKGTWKQGQATPLDLKRTSAEAVKPKRPQEAAIAASPATYTSSEVGFDNVAAKVKLAGTFTVPQGKGPFPAVVLVHGSGPLDRDSEVFGHKLFLVLADHLSRQGIAVLRYDKRGIGKSTGTLRESTTLDLADDAGAAVRFLRTRPEVDSARIGVVGHSEGGLIAPLIASRDPALGFVVMLAAPACAATASWWNRWRWRRKRAVRRKRASPASAP
ncbi:alpha/beta fold hydrolase [Massilia sp. Dwa41.01b]|uniref:alpha/beta hydrolase family protein n=1 Tax=Massilia sp. Dwa41.01b TaxID=2709302 RepID=UPI00160344A0|nr:alpha/beta fold hydrolase [Massilia sp. Dwa41.01b]QNA87780.1 alpha/beta fold hydrolase [Massilia sp. Dwa41.01b]